MKMKNLKFTKVFVLVLSLVLLIGAATGLVSSAEEAVTKPEIISQNINYGGDFAIIYAVPVSSVNTEGDGQLVVTVYSDAECQTSVGTFTRDKKNGEFNVETVNGVECYTFTTNGIAAKEMKVQYYAQVTDASGNVSDVKRYSVAEYMYERLYGGKKTISTEQKELYEVVLDFGVKAQKVLNTADTKYVTDYYFASVAEGAVDGTYAQGVFHKDDAHSFTLGTYTGTVPEFHTLSGWTVTKTASDGTVTTTTAQDGATVTVDAHTVVTPNFKKQAIDFEDNSLSKIVEHGPTNSQRISSGIVESPTDNNASNKALETVVKSALNSGSSAVGHAIPVDGNNGNTYILDLNIKFESVKEEFGRIYFGNGFGSSNYLYLRNWENDSLATIAGNNIKGEVVNALPLNDWANLRLEVYNIYDGDTYSETKIKVIIDGEYKGEMTTTTVIAPTHFTIRYASGASSTENATITIDDIMAVRCDLEYKAD